MKAKLIVEEEAVYPDGSFVRLTAWLVPKPVPPSRHLYKYSFVYIVSGERVLGYDNERGKGDHRHRHGQETSITFSTLQDLVDEFLSEVSNLRGEA